MQKPKWLLTSVRPGREEVGQPWYPQTTEDTLGANHYTNASGNLEAGAQCSFQIKPVSFESRFAFFFFANLRIFDSSLQELFGLAVIQDADPLKNFPTWETKSTFNWSKLFAIEALSASFDWFWNTNHQIKPPASSVFLCEHKQGPRIKRIIIQRGAHTRNMPSSLHPNSYLTLY